MSAGFSKDALGLSWRRDWEDDLSRLRDPAFLRRKAKSVVKKISSDADPVSARSVYKVNRWYEYAGQALGGLPYHDDFRAEPASAPRIALWLLEVPDLDGESVTVIVIHGTANENLARTSLGNMPSSRLGSQTEALFEAFWAYENYAEIHPAPSTPADRAVDALHQVVNGYWDKKRLDVEVLFQVLSVYDRPSIRENQDEVVSWGSTTALTALTEKPGGALVSRYVVGTPILVQTT